MLKSSVTLAKELYLKRCEEYADVVAAVQPARAKLLSVNNDAAINDDRGMATIVISSRQMRDVAMVHYVDLKRDEEAKKNANK